MSLGAEMRDTMGDVIGLARAQQCGDGEMAASVICGMTVRELVLAFPASLGLVNQICDALDHEREAAGLEPVADTILTHLAS